MQEGGLYLLLFLLPFSKAAVEILFGVLLLGWVLERADPLTRWDSIWTRRGIRHLALALVGYLAVCGLSIIGSSNPVLSLSGFINKWLEYMWYMVIVADIGVRPMVVKRSMVMIACSSLFVVIEGIAQEILGHGIFLRHSIVMYARMSGPYENPTDLATFIMVAILLLLGYVLTLRTIGRALVFGILLLLTICFGRVMAIGPWMAFGVAITVLCVRSTAIRRYVLMLTLAVVLSGAYFLERTGNARTALNLRKPGTVDRVFMWEAAVNMIKDRPILGHGLNTFMANYLKYWVGGERQPRYAHNCFLQVAAETGMLGLGTFLWLFWVFFSCLMRGLRQSPSEEGFILLGLFSGLLAFTIHASVDTNFYALRQAALFWILAGLTLGLSERILQSSPAGQ